MIDYLMSNIDSVVMLIVMILLILFLFLKGRKKLVAQIILYLVEIAEEKFGSGTGAIKYDYVVEKLYNIVPVVIKIFLTKKEINYLIDKSINQLKLYLIE